MEDVLSFLRSLGEPDEIIRQAVPDLTHPAPVVNTHVHLPPNFSAFESVRHAIEKACQEGLWVIGAGNYYDYRIYKDLCKVATRLGVFPLFGTEIIAMQEDLRDAAVRVNDPVNPGKTYICGKGITRFDPPSPKAKALLDLIRSNDASRAEQMTARLDRFWSSNGLATGLDAATIIKQVATRYGCPEDAVVLQERHLAMAFQQRLFEIIPEGRRSKVLGPILSCQCEPGLLEDPVGLQEQLRTSLMKAGRPCFVAEQYISLGQARQLIGELGGIECYPVVADMVSPHCEFELDVHRLAERLRQMGLTMVEFISVRNSPQVLTEYAVGLRKAGLAVSNGTEHNTLQMLPLAPSCKGGLALSEELKQLFWEGACVIAGHQYLAAHGQVGFVDQDGRPNQRWSDPDRGIRSIAAIGQEVIHRFLDRYGGVNH